MFSTRYRLRNSGREFITFNRQTTFLLICYVKIVIFRSHFWYQNPKFSIFIVISKGDTFDLKVSQSETFTWNLQISEYPKMCVTFEMKVSLCDTLMSKVSPFKITIISDNLIFWYQKWRLWHFFFTFIFVYDLMKNVTNPQLAIFFFLRDL